MKWATTQQQCLVACVANSSCVAVEWSIYGCWVGDRHHRRSDDYENGVTTFELIRQRGNAWWLCYTKCRMRVHTSGFIWHVIGTHGPCTQKQVFPESSYWLWSWPANILSRRRVFKAVGLDAVLFDIHTLISKMDERRLVKSISQIWSC